MLTPTVRLPTTSSESGLGRAVSGLTHRIIPRRSGRADAAKRLSSWAAGMSGKRGLRAGRDGRRRTPSPRRRRRQGPTGLRTNPMPR